MSDKLLSELLEVGKITSPQGLKGELRVYSNSDFPERFTQAGTRWLQHPDNHSVREVQLERGRYLAGKNLYVIKLEGIKDRNEAQMLRNYKLLVDKSDRPKLSPDEYHVADLIGLEVYDRSTQKKIGTVIDLYSAGNDLLEIKPDKQPAPTAVKSDKPIEQGLRPDALQPAQTERDLSQISRRSKRKRYKSKAKKPPTILIPFVKEIVPIVDLANQRIEISPPDGLIDLHQTEDREEMK